MSKRAALLMLLLVAGCGADEPPSADPGAAARERALKGSPPALAALHQQADEILGGGPEAFKHRLAELEGHPVVVNKWASWCPGCATEFPFFQRQGLRRGREVAFIGVNSNDNTDNAKRFLERLPLSYPSYDDPEQKIAKLFDAEIASPATGFYTSNGKLAHVKLGAYVDEEDFIADIERYAR